MKPNELPKIEIWQKGFELSFVSPLNYPDALKTGKIEVGINFFKYTLTFFDCSEQITLHEDIFNENATFKLLMLERALQIVKLIVEFVNKYRNKPYTTFKTKKEYNEFVKDFQKFNSYLDFIPHVINYKDDQNYYYYREKKYQKQKYELYAFKISDYLELKTQLEKVAKIQRF